jgi:hypothetical protein
MSMPRGFLFWGRKVDEPLCVEVDGTSIIVTMPGTDFSVTYQKEIDAPHLVLTHMGSATSLITSLGHAPFTQRSRRRASLAGSFKRPQLFNQALNPFHAEHVCHGALGPHVLGGNRKTNDDSESHEKSHRAASCRLSGCGFSSLWLNSKTPIKFILNEVLT